MTPALMARGLTVRLRTDAGTVHAASDVDLTLHRGSVHALVGESGCGKSVVAAALCGLLPRAATVSGTVVLGDDEAGVSLVGASEKTLRGVRGHRIALVPQSAATFLTPVRTVGSQLRETCRHLGAARAPGDLLTTVGLDIGVAALYPHELSGGMAQRVAVAFALAGDPEVIVADEPTSSLDPELTDRILGLLGRCAADGAAVLLITHDIEALAGRADRISVMYASRIMEVGPCADVLGDPWHPYTADLLAALPSGGLVPLPGMPPELTDLDDECVYHLRTSAAAGFSGGPTTLVEDPPGRFVRRLVSR